MSLFDVIKYPVPDIEDKTELLKIPFPILLNWWKEIVRVMDIKVSTREIPRTSEYLILWMHTSHPWPARGEPHYEGMKDEFAKCLYRHIRDYEGPV